MREIESKRLQEAIIEVYVFEELKIKIPPTVTS